MYTAILPHLDKAQTSSLAAWLWADVNTRVHLAQGKEASFDSWVLHDDDAPDYAELAKNLGIETPIHSFHEVQSDDFNAKVTSFIQELHDAGEVYFEKKPALFCGSCERWLSFPIGYNPDGELTIVGKQVNHYTCPYCAKRRLQRKKAAGWYLKLNSHARQIQKLISSEKCTDGPIRRALHEWLGERQGFVVTMPLHRIKDFTLDVWLPKLEWLFGGTFCLISPQHPGYGRLAQLGHKSYHLINPVGGPKIPLRLVNDIPVENNDGIWFGIPAHDDRAQVYAREHGLPKREVVVATHQPSHGHHDQLELIDQRFLTTSTRTGKDSTHSDDELLLINSGIYSGLSSSIGREKIRQDLEKKSALKEGNNFSLPDWLLAVPDSSRPRFSWWQCESCSQLNELFEECCAQCQASPERHLYFSELTWLFLQLSFHWSTQGTDQTTILGEKNLIWPLLMLHLGLQNTIQTWTGTQLRTKTFQTESGFIKDIMPETDKRNPHLNRILLLKDDIANPRQATLEKIRSDLRAITKTLHKIKQCSYRENRATPSWDAETENYLAIHEHIWHLNLMYRTGHLENIWTEVKHLFRMIDEGLETTSQPFGAGLYSWPRLLLPILPGYETDLTHPHSPWPTTDKLTLESTAVDFDVNLNDSKLGEINAPILTKTEDLVSLAQAANFWPEKLKPITRIMIERHRHIEFYTDEV